MITTLRFAPSLQESIKKLAGSPVAAKNATTAPAKREKASIHPDGADLLTRLEKDSTAYVCKLASGAFRLVRLTARGWHFTALKAKAVRDLLSFGLLHFDRFSSGNLIYKAG